MGKLEPLTPREAQIMEILWKQERATAEEIRSALAGDPHDSTVRTFLRILVRKGHVRRSDTPEGIVYRPTTRRRQAQKRAVMQLIERFFGGSAEDLVMRMLEDERITPEQLDELRKRMEENQ